jgi:hypothetical protein
MLSTDFFLWEYKVLKKGKEYLSKADSADQNVLNNSNYRLETNFANIFRKEESEHEVIFKWPYSFSEYLGGYPDDWLYATTNISSQHPEWVNDSIPVTPSPQWVNITLAYADSLYSNPNDTRAPVSYKKFHDFGWVNKYPGSLKDGVRHFDSDIDVYRYADAILFDAEIKMYEDDIEGAKKALNRIAKRAYNINNFYDFLSTKEEVLKAIVKEREKEFVGEGRTWWDFIRLGVIFKKDPYLKGRKNETNILLWPVSNKTLNSNPNIKQTNGY